MEKDHKKPTARSIERAVCSTTRACRYYYTGYSILKIIFFTELGNQKCESLPPIKITKISCILVLISQITYHYQSDLAIFMYQIGPFIDKV